MGGRSFVTTCGAFEDTLGRALEGAGGEEGKVLTLETKQLQPGCFLCWVVEWSRQEWETLGHRLLGLEPHTWRKDCGRGRGVGHQGTLELLPRFSSARRQRSFSVVTLKGGSST